MEEKSEEEKKESQSIVNPIDEDKIAENPHLLPYAHTVGGAVIKPIDKGRTKGLAVSAMHEQTNMQLDQIKQQVELLAEQAKKIQKRVEISEQIYTADVGFKPLINHIYHLYEKEEGVKVLSMVDPEEWGRASKLKYVATVKLLADHTWDILRSSEDEAFEI